MSKNRIAVIVPTFNAAAHLESLLPALASQGLPRERFLFVDSSSTDTTVEQLRAFGGQLISIPQKTFNHGGTRRMATRAAPDSDVFVLLTQDAIPNTTDSIDRLVAAFDDPRVGMAYGRQLPRDGAGPIEAFARTWNYPSQSEVRTMADRGRLGVKTIFSSNSFAAYRASDLEGVGGFPDPADFAEDQIVAARMILAGRALAYVADAEVRHSHGYSLREDFDRYRCVGKFHGQQSWILETFGRAEGEGARFVVAELKHLLRRGPTLIPSAMARTLAKYAGYKSGLQDAARS